MSLPEFDKLWKYEDPAGTEARFREILPQAEGSGSINYHAELLTQIARCQGLQEHFDAAHATLDRVEEMLQPDMRRARVRYLLERGRVFNSSGNPDKSLPLFKDAMDLGRIAGETRLEFDALHMIAIVHAQPDLQIEWNLKGIAAVEKTPSEKRWLYAFYNNLGEAYAKKLDYESALKAFRDLAQLDIDRGQPADLHAQKDIAKMLRKLGRIDEALVILCPLYDELERKAQPDPWIDEEMAECLLIKGRDTEAKPLLVRAYESQKDMSWEIKNEPAKLARLKQLAGK